MILETSNAALADRYDAVAYAAQSHPLTHPDRLASVATFLGMSPPAPAHCRVLEVGCNDGSNLIPMALSLPSARFVGCDLAPSAIAIGRKTIADLGLANITLVVEDLAALDRAHGEFDYIVAHGVYSWVPPRVRDALFALAAERLAADGIMFVSYNALPGTRIRQAAWEVLHYHVDHLDDQRARLAAARELARIVGEGSSRTLLESDEVLRAEFRAIAQTTDSALAHDDLGVPNDPCWFHEFAAHAQRFGLAYLAEAELHTMSAAGLAPDAKVFLSTLDPRSREQYLDFVRLRRFRQSLLRRTEARIDPTARAERIGAMHVSADGSLLRAQSAGKVGELAADLDPARGDQGPARALLDLLVARSPAAVAVAELGLAIGSAALPRPLDVILTEACVSNIVNLHVHPARLVTEPGARPVASPLARLQARSQEYLTNLCHARVRVPDVNARRLLMLLDGTRERGQLASAIAGADFGYSPETASRFVTHALEQFGRMALLTA